MVSCLVTVVLGVAVDYLVCFCRVGIWARYDVGRLFGFVVLSVRVCGCDLLVV